MSSFPVLLGMISWILCTVFGADCRSQPNSASCKSVSGCEWFNDACICATEVKVDFLFVVDLSGSIGSSSFKQAQEWLSNVVIGGLTKDSRVGWILFSTHANTNDVTLTSYTNAQLVEYVTNIKYTGGLTDTKSALKAVIAEYAANGLPTRQKVAIMVTDGNPCVNSECPQDVCEYASQLKNADIRLLVIGVGRSLTPAHLTCLLQEPDNDYMPVKSYNYDDFNEILPQLQKITCPVSYDMTITEVKVQHDTYAGFGSRFVEIWNSGSSLSGSDIMLSGLIAGTLSSSVHIDQSQYLVLYDVGDTFKNITCVNCNCNPQFSGSAIKPPALYKCADVIYYPCTDSSGCTFSDNMDNTNWWLQIDEVSQSGVKVLIDDVKYVDSYWPIALDGYSFELREIGYDNSVGSNWAQSCYTFGTPGDEPIACSRANCTQATCKQNGANTAKLNPNTGQCQCPTGYYRDKCTCLSLATPSNCVAFRIKNTTSNSWYTQYEWQRTGFDGTVQYQLRYANQGGTETTVQLYGIIKKVLEYDWENRGASEVAGYLKSMIVDANDDNVYYYSDEAECLAVTQSPTKGPTPAPTSSPTLIPTNEPSPSPTHSLPMMFIGGNICLKDRCECGETTETITDLNCCLSETDDCNEYKKRYTASAMEEVQYITIQSFDPFGHTYAPPFDTFVYYEFEYIGIETGNISNNVSNITSGSEHVMPMSITPMNGTVYFGDEANDNLAEDVSFVSDKKISFNIESTTTQLIGDGGDIVFRLSLLSCKSSYDLNANEECEVVFPSQLTLYVQQVTLAEALTWWEKEIVPILWWVIAALAAFIALVAFLVYWFWYRTYMKAKAIAVADKEYQGLIEEEEYGMAPDLNKDEIGYNPLALRANNKNDTDLPGNTKIPRNERANVLVEKFQDRHEYGQNVAINLAQMKTGDENETYVPPKMK